MSDDAAPAPAATVEADDSPTKRASQASVTSQDRRSGMANSSVKAPPKKGGAGGSYTWGSALDVTDYESKGLPVTGIGVVTSIGPTVVTSPTAVASPTFQLDQGAFPTLGATVQPRVVSGWGPGPRTQVTLASTSLRPGALEVIDSTHPRNLFAKKPTVRTGTTTIAKAPVQERTIDWSSTGMPEALVKAVLQPTPAHLGPYGQAAVPIAQETLLARNAATQRSLGYQQPTVARSYAQTSRPMKQYCSRGPMTR